MDGYGRAAWTAQYQGDDGWSPVNHFYVYDSESGIESSRLQVLDLSQYTNLGATDIHELVFDYAPILKMDESDYFSPKEVDIFTWAATLRDSSGTPMAWNGTAEGLGGYVGDSYYLDLPALTHSGAASNFAAISSNYEDAIYATVVEGASLDRLAIEYWFPYYMSDWGNQGGYNTHEGDWEGIVVTFSDTGPEKAAYSQHKTSLADLSTYRDWANVERSATHPIVYFGLGGHASYFTDSDFVGPESILAPDLSFYDEHHDGNGIALSATGDLDIIVVPNSTTGSLSSVEWLKYGGHWGQDEWEDPDRLFGGDGPIGPVSSSYWADPFSWVDGLPEEPGPFPTRFRDDFFESMTAILGTPVRLEGKLEEDTLGNPAIANEDVYFQIDVGSGWETIPEDGIAFSHFTTDANGIGSVYYLVPEGLAPGDYEYRAVYEGVGNYAGTVSLPQTLNVTRSATSYPETPDVEHTIGSGVPLILVHGNGNEGEEEAAWGTFLNYVDAHPAEYAPFDVYNWVHDTHLAIGFNGSTGNADELGRFVDDYVLPNYSPGTKPVFLAHSRGGLVARSFMGYVGQGDGVLGLVTLGTPHHGSPFAVPDWDAVSWASMCLTCSSARTASLALVQKVSIRIAWAASILRGTTLIQPLRGPSARAISTSSLRTMVPYRSHGGT